MFPAVFWAVWEAGRLKVLQETANEDALPENSFLNRFALHS